MQQFYLTEIKTNDHLLHQGVFYRGKKTGKCAFLWVHGFMGKFYGNLKLYQEFTRVCDQYGFGFAAFNNRGHDIVTGIKKIGRTKTKYLTVGASSEYFTDCVYDIAAGIRFLRTQKYEKIILVGHSTGANKVCYYAAEKKDPRVLGVVLAGPVSDRLVNPFCNKLAKKLGFMRKLVQRGRGDKLIAPYSNFPVMTPKRFLSLYTPGSVEDTFDYGEKKPKLTCFSKIKKPLLVLLGGEDEYLDRPAEKVKRIFEAHAHSKYYQFRIIPKTNHGFQGKEREFMKAIMNWANEN